MNTRASALRRSAQNGVWEYRNLLRSLVSRNLKVKYQRSALGSRVAQPYGSFEPAPASRPRTAVRVTMLVALSTLLGAGTACDSDEPSGPGDRSGEIRVTVSTSGSLPDPDGYLVTVDGSPGQDVDVDGTVVIEEVSPGEHVVRLDGAAAGCDAAGGSTRTVVLEPRGSADVAFHVTCAGVTVQVRTSTLGPDSDPNGYTVVVDDAAPVAAASNGTLAVGPLRPGEHVLVLGDVAPNCTVAGGTTQAVNATADVASVEFTVSCTALPTGSIEVQVTTEGPQPDPDGYVVTVDGSQGVITAVNGTVVVTSVRPGPHVVTLSGVASNCLAPPPAPVTVESGQTSRITLVVTCSVPGSILARVFVTGTQVPPLFAISLDNLQISFTAGPVGAVRFSPVPPGTHVVALAVSGSCTVAGGASRTVQVVEGQELEVRFDVSCP